MKRVPFLLIGILLLISSCAPRPVYRMKPIAKNTTFNQGTEYVHKHDGDVKMTLSYYRHMGNKFVMDVEIDNRTDSVIRIDPLQFSYQAYQYYSADTTSGSSNVTPSVKIASRKAINPETKILEKDKAISRKIAAQKTSDLIFAIGTAANVASYAIADTDQKRDEIGEDQDRYGYDHRLARHERNLKKRALRDQREVWEIDALRKTDVFPGEYIRGFVFFKTNPNARGYVIQYRNGSAQFNVFFRQLRYESN